MGGVWMGSTLDGIKNAILLFIGSVHIPINNSPCI